MDLDLPPLLDPSAVPSVLGRDEALRRGFTRAAIEHRLRTGRWRRVLPRTYLTTGTLTWDDKLRAALAFAGAGALLSGAAALTDQVLRSVARPNSVLVLVPRTTAVRTTQWARIRRTDRLPDAALLPGPARVPLSRAVADLALDLRREDDVRALVAEAVRRQVCSVEELSHELHAGPRRHSAHLRRAIEEVGAGAWSAPEGRAARLLRGNVPPFEQNAEIRLTTGRRVIVDFLWRALRAVLEIDSDAHHALAGDADRTSDRHLWLQTDGYSTIHRTPRQIARSPEAFVREVAAWRTARAARVA